MWSLQLGLVDSFHIHRYENRMFEVVGVIGSCHDRNTSSQSGAGEL